MADLRQRKTIHLANFDYKGSAYVYFITVCTANKQFYFQDKNMARIIEDELEYRRIADEIRLFCYCIMPNHLHILLSLTEEYKKNLQNWVSAFKRYTARVANEFFAINPLWQKNFHEHIVRNEESLLEITKYILNNPVRKGLVSEWSEYQYSKMIDTVPL